MPAIDDVPSAQPTSSRRGARLLLLAAGVVLAVLAVRFIVVEAHELRWVDIRAALAAIPTARFGAALLLVVAGYGWLVLYDVVALAGAGKRVPARALVSTSFFAYAFANNLGLNAFTAAAIRARRYSHHGLTPRDLGRVILSTTTTLWLGLATALGVALFVEPVAPLHAAAARALALVLLAIPALYVGLAVRGLPELKIRSLSFSLPTAPLALAQVAVGSVDWILTAALLWMLLPPGAPFFFVVVAVGAAEAVAMASHIPGGVGVLEGALLALFGNRVDHASLITAILAFRVLYYLVPLVVAAAFALAEAAIERRGLARRVSAVVGPAVPSLAAGLVFIAGAALLASAAMPAIEPRVRALAVLVPLFVRKLSHVVAGAVGVSLLVVARGLWRRLDVAWSVAVALVVGGAAVSMLNGLQFAEAGYLTFVALVLVAARRQFYRPGALVHEPLSWWWFFGATAVVLGILSLEASSTFELAHDPARFTRATIAALGTAFVLVVRRLLQPARAQARTASADDVADAERILRRHGYGSEYCVLFTGDKCLLFDDARTAFVMFGVARTTFVALFDPVGPPAGKAAVVRKLRELADWNGATCFFYEVSADSLPLLFDEGLAVHKIGEDARVSLATFSLEGRTRRTLRQSCSRAERDGLAFAVVDGAERDALLPALRRISEEWLTTRNAREKAFSMGAFDERYLQRAPVALMRMTSSARVVAFANLWTSGDGKELSVDLMRYSNDAPSAAMEALFVELMLWAKARGFESFDLGMAPLAGVDDSSLWSKASHIVFRFGEHFYNFRGLRAFKEKFDPIWTPRYVALPSDLALPRALAALAALTSGGLRGVFTKPLKEASSHEPPHPRSAESPRLLDAHR